MDAMISSVLFIIIWFLVLGVRDFRNYAQLLVAYWLVIILHQAVALTNAFGVTTLGADADAITFHQAALELAQSGNFSFSIGARFYENMLGIVYWFFGPSLMLGQQLSILAFSLSCIVLIKIQRLMGLKTHSATILLAFGALPTMFLLGSITLRESYQILFFMLAVYFGIRMHIKGGINIYFFVMIIFSLVLGLFHHALAVYVIFLIVLMMIWPFRPVSFFWSIKKLQLIAILVLPILTLGVWMASRMQIYGLDGLTSFVNMDLLESASRFRDKSILSRATYGVVLDLSSPFMGIYSSILLYLHYLFSPFPWQARNAMDIYASLESVLRLILIYYSIKQWRNSYGVQRRVLLLMLVLFFSMTFMWALGTTNYGTAMRHHMLSWWIIVVIGLPLLITSVRYYFLSLVVNRRLFLTSKEKHS